MRVLIVRLGAFGDIVHTLPLAADLAAEGHHVGWLCEDRWACLVRDNPAISQVHAIPRRMFKGGNEWGLGRRYQTLREVIRALRGGAYDAVIDAQGLAKSAVLALCSRARLRIGHHRPRSREGAWLVGRRRTPVGAEHVIDQQRALGLPVLGSDHPRGPWRFPLPAWHAEREQASDWLRQQGLELPWMLNVGAGWPTKVWPRERQIAFVEKAASEHRRRIVLLWGSYDERVLAEAIVQQVPTAILAPPTTIPELAGLMSHAGVVVSGDTGPLHLALALGVPAIGLFGPVPATRNGPRGCGYRTFQAPGAAWERKDVSKVDLGAISATDVLNAAEAVVRERAGHE
jgi:heptosyltransferase I